MPEKTSDKVAKLMIQGKTAAEIAQELDLNAAHAGRVVKELTGPHGGTLLTLPLDEVTVNERVQLRAIDGGIDLEVVDDYAAAMQAGAKFPPVVVVLVGEEHVLADGFHRYASARKAGGAEIDVEVVVGTLMDAYLLAARSNSTNGMRFSRKDRRKAVTEMLTTFPELMELGPREFERKTGINEATFRKIVNELKQQADAARAATAGTAGEDEADDDDAGDEFTEATGPADADDAGDEDDAGDDPPHVVYHRQRHKLLEKLPAEDIENLMKSQVFMDLDGDRLGCFVGEYLYRQSMAEALEVLRVAHHANKPKGRLVPVMPTMMEMVLKVRTYLDFSVCGNCGGKGCTECRKRGYC